MGDVLGIVMTLEVEFVAEQVWGNGGEDSESWVGGGPQFCMQNARV